MAKRGRPKSTTRPTYAEMGLRGTIQERELIDRAVPIEAARLGLSPSRNSFCIRAALAAAKRELGIVDGSNGTEA